MAKLEMVIPSKMETVFLKLEEYLKVLIAGKIKDEREESLKKKLSSNWLEKLIKGGQISGIKGASVGTSSVAPKPMKVDTPLADSENKESSSGFFRRLLLGDKKETASMLSLLKKIEHNTDPERKDLKSINLGETDQPKQVSDGEKASGGILDMLKAFFPATTGLLSGAVTLLKSFGSLLGSIVSGIARLGAFLGSKLASLVTGLKDRLTKTGTTIAEDSKKKPGAEKPKKVIASQPRDAKGRFTKVEPPKEVRLRDAKGRFVKAPPVSAADDVAKAAASSTGKGVVKGAGRILSKAAVPLALGMAAFDVVSTETDSTLTREQKNIKHAGTGGGLAGAAAGAASGAAIGALGGPIGIALGALVGGIAGGIGGSAAGEKIAENIYAKPKEDTLSAMDVSYDSNVSVPETSKMAKNMDAAKSTANEIDSAQRSVSAPVVTTVNGGSTVVNSSTKIQGAAFGTRNPDPMLDFLRARSLA